MALTGSDLLQFSGLSKQTASGQPSSKGLTGADLLQFSQSTPTSQPTQPQTDFTNSPSNINNPNSPYYQPPQQPNFFQQAGNFLGQAGEVVKQTAKQVIDFIPQAPSYAKAAKDKPLETVAGGGEAVLTAFGSLAGLVQQGVASVAKVNIPERWDISKQTRALRQLDEQLLQKSGVDDKKAFETGRFVGSFLPYALGSEVAGATIGAKILLPAATKFLPGAAKFIPTINNAIGFLGVGQIEHDPENGSRVDQLKNDLIMLSMFEVGGVAAKGLSQGTKNLISKTINDVKGKPKIDFETVQPQVQAVKDAIKADTGKSPEVITAETMAEGKPPIAKGLEGGGGRLYHGTNNPEAIAKGGFSISKGSQEGSSFLGDNFVEGVHLSKSKAPYQAGGQLEDVASVLEVSHGAKNILKTDLQGIGELYKKYGINEMAPGASIKLTNALKKAGYEGLEYGDEIVIFDPKKVTTQSPSGLEGGGDSLIHARGTKAAADLGGFNVVGKKNLAQAERTLQKAGELPAEIKAPTITKDFIKNYYETKKAPVVGDVFVNAKGERIEITKVAEDNIRYFLKGKNKGIEGIIYTDKPFFSSSGLEGGGGKLQPLAEEARIYHGTTPDAAKAIEKAGFDVTKSADGSIWFTSNKNAITNPEGVGTGNKGAIIERLLPKDLKLADRTLSDKYSVDELINMGFDGAKFNDIGQGKGTYYQIFNPEKLKLSSPLKVAEEAKTGQPIESGATVKPNGKEVPQTQDIKTAQAVKGENAQLQGKEPQTSQNVEGQIPEVKPQEVSVPREQLPVGQGAEKVSRLEARIKGVTDKLSQEEIDKLGVATYNEVKNKENIRLASEYIVKNPEDGLKILKGEIEPPKGILRNAVYLAMEQSAKEDITLATKLASLSSTRAGQEISILRELDPSSPVKIASDIFKIKEEVFKKRYSGKSPQDVIKSMAEKGKKEIKTPTKLDWGGLISSIKCK